MPKYVVKDAIIEIDDIDLSARASRATVTSSKALVDSTTFGADYRENVVGLGDASIAVTFQQDFDTAQTDATLWPIHSAGRTCRVRVIPTSGAISETNPAYVMEAALIPDYTPLNGSVGDLSTVDVTFQNAGQRGVERVTTPDGS